MAAAESRMLMGGDSTIRRFIKSFEAEELTFNEFYLRQYLKHKTGREMIVNFGDLLVKYMPELQSLKVRVTLSDEEYKKYRYNPKRMSYDLYGTTELWSLLLNANELLSVTEFNLRTLYVFSSSIIDKLRRILNLEEEVKNYDAEELSAAMGG